MDDFGDRKGNIVTPPWKINEDTIRPRHGNAGRHKAVEGEDGSNRPIDVSCGIACVWP
jgi:hypothetical protein